MISLNFITVAKANVTSVMVVRHAETDYSDPENRDPGLSPKGERRASLLNELAKSLDVKAVFSSEYQRTQRTVVQIAERLNSEINVIGAREPDLLAQTIREKNAGDTVIVAGHSNTVPWVVKSLGGGLVDNLDHSDYNTFYIVLTGDEVAERTEEIKEHFPDVEEVNNVTGLADNMKLLKGGYGQDISFLKSFQTNK